MIKISHFKLLNLQSKTVIMELNVNVKIELSENTLNALTAVLKALTVGDVKAPVNGKVKALAEIKQAAPEPKEQVAAASAVGISDQAASIAKIDIEALRLQIRSKVVALRDAGHKQQTLDLMAEYGITSLSKLTEAQVPEFLTRLNAIA